MRNPNSFLQSKRRRLVAVPIQPLADYIVAQEEEAQTKTASGILLPEAAKEKPKTAKVVGVGPQVKHVKLGDSILYKSYSTTDVKVGNVDYLLVKEEDVLAKVM
jgi:chaperonin GroES